MTSSSMRDFLSGCIFYPGSGTDFAMVRRLCQRSSRFLYVDPRWRSAASFEEEALPRMEIVGITLESSQRMSISEFPPPRTYFNSLTPWEHEAYQRSNSARGVGWAQRYHLSAPMGAQRREIELIMLSADGVATWQSLFSATGLSPLALVTKAASVGGFGGGNWTNFELRDGALARSVLGSGSKPRFWVSTDGWPYRRRGGYAHGYQRENWRQAPADWPWRFPHQMLAPGLVLWAQSSTPRRESYQLAGRVLVHHQLLSEADIANADGAFVIARLERRFRLAGIPSEKMLTFQRYRGRGRDIPELVMELSRLCMEAEQRGWRNVVSMVAGYPDEGRALLEWAPSISLERLELFLKHPGDLDDIEGVAPMNSTYTKRERP